LDELLLELLEFEYTELLLEEFELEFDELLLEEFELEFDELLERVRAARVRAAASSVKAAPWPASSWKCATACAGLARTLAASAAIAGLAPNASATTDAAIIDLVCMVCSFVRQQESAGLKATIAAADLFRVMCAMPLRGEDNAVVF
jgi:hypothetical protein